MLLTEIKNFFEYYGQEKKMHISSLLALSVICGFLEFIGVALVYPFVKLMLEPTYAIHLPNQLKFLNAISFANTSQVMIFLGISIVLMFLFKNILMIIFSYLQTKFISNWKQETSGKIMKYYIYAPYSALMNSTIDEKMHLLSTVSEFVFENFVRGIFNFCTNIIVMLVITAFLLWKFPVAAVFTILFLAVCFCIQASLIKRKMNYIKNNLYNKQRSYQKILSDIIMIALKNLRETSTEDLFFKDFDNKLKEYSNISFELNFYSRLHTYVIEILIVLSIFILASIIFIQNAGNNTLIITSFAVMGTALFRLAPAINRIQLALVNVNMSKKFLFRMNEEYRSNNKLKYIETESNCPKKPFNTCLELKNISFSYDGKIKVIDNLSLTINKSDFIGIVGSSGAGKTTLIDIIMGFFTPQTGSVLLDKMELNQSNYREFRKNIGYVSQKKNVFKSTFKENIALGLPPEQINDDEIIKALQDAQIYDVIKEIDGGINAELSDIKNKLSHGQEQRLIIARALYKKADLLILDEPTSSQDAKHEGEIIDVIKSFSSQKTIIVISHRPTTLKICNKLIYLKDGRIADTGTFEELSDRNPDFIELFNLKTVKN